MKLTELAELLGAQLVGEDHEIENVASLAAATAGQLAFYNGSEDPPQTDASCVIVSIEAADRFPRTPASLLIHEDPKLAFAKAAEHILSIPTGTGNPPAIHTTAEIRPSATINDDVRIGAFTSVGENAVIGEGTRIAAGVRIGPNVNIGARCEIHPNVVIEAGCAVGDNVVLHAGAVIGADGFGHVRDGDEGYVKFPQIGTVVIEDHVEIGANTCIDRGALGETRVGSGTKIDNLVQVGHNVNIGKRCVIAAQTGISGSVVIEDDCVIGGQVGFGDHAVIKAGSVIGSQAGILPGKIVRKGVWWGTPVMPLDEYKRMNARLKSLERMYDDIRQVLRSPDESDK